MKASPSTHELLVTVVQELSLARSTKKIQEIVRTAARALTHADGATFVLRAGDDCWYVDEDAITPLWKGLRFPMDRCISGWAMLRGEAVAIDDVMADPRIPHDVYRQTFVKSLVMVPIRRAAPIGALGAYWATSHRADEDEIRILQALADSTSIAMENVQLYAQLEDRVAERTAELAAATVELEAFAYSVSHDLRAPLRAVHGFAQAVLEDVGETIEPTSRGHLERVVNAAIRMNGLIEALLELSRVHKNPLVREPVDVTAMAREVVGELALRDPTRQVDVVVADGLAAAADPRLFRNVLDNLVGNAWKFTAYAAAPRIEVGKEADGTLFRSRQRRWLRNEPRPIASSRPFQRLHTADEFPGTGIGLATVARIVRRHGGTISIDSKPNVGTVVRFRV